MHLNKLVAPHIDAQNYADRQTMLKYIPRAKAIKDKELAPHPTASQVWGRDVSMMDHRSVKAFLAGRGDFRVFWWNLNCAIHRILFPLASMEVVMYAFHKRHHYVTLGWLKVRCDFRLVAKSILNQGLIAGYRKALELQ